MAPSSNLIPAIKMLLKDLSHNDFLNVIQSELGNKERITALQGISEWAGTQLLTTAGAQTQTGDSFSSLSHDNLYALLQKELAKEDRLGVLQCIVDWSVPELVYAPSTSITKVRFTGTVTSFDDSSKIGFIKCDEAQEIFGTDVIVEGDQVRKGVRVDDRLSFAILRDSAHKPQAFDVVNETMVEKEHSHRERREQRGKGKREGKGRKRNREQEGEEAGDGLEELDELDAASRVGDDAEEGEEAENGEGKGHSQRERRGRKGDKKGRLGKKRRKGEKGEKGEGKGDRGEKGDRKGGGKGDRKGKGGPLVPQAGVGQQNMGLTMKPSAAMNFVPPGSLIGQRLAPLNRGPAGKGSFASSLMRKAIGGRIGQGQSIPARGQVIPAGANNPQAGKGLGKASGKVIQGKGDSICWNFKQGRCWKSDCPWSHSR